MWFRRSRDPVGNPDAERAVRESKKALHQVRSRSEEVHEVAEASRRFRRENHFADSLQDLFNPDRGV